MPYGAQTAVCAGSSSGSFESCVMPYGAQTYRGENLFYPRFESCVMPYGAQTAHSRAALRVLFESCVMPYGAQTVRSCSCIPIILSFPHMRPTYVGRFCMSFLPGVCAGVTAVLVVCIGRPIWRVGVRSFFVICVVNQNVYQGERYTLSCVCLV